MSDKNKEVEFHVIAPEGIEAARRYHALLEEYHADMALLAEEYKKRAEEIRALSRKARQTVWTQMAVAAGVDADKSWDAPGWSIDVNYLDHGFAALVHHRPEPHPMMAMVAPPVADEDEEEGVPEGASVN